MLLLIPSSSQLFQLGGSEITEPPFFMPGSARIRRGLPIPRPRAFRFMAAALRSSDSAVCVKLYFSRPMTANASSDKRFWAKPPGVNSTLASGMQKVAN
jgi:hypothetical protein